MSRNKNRLILSSFRVLKLRSSPLMWIHLPFLLLEWHCHSSRNYILKVPDNRNSIQKIGRNVGGEFNHGNSTSVIISIIPQYVNLVILQNLLHTSYDRLQSVSTDVDTGTQPDPHGATYRWESVSFLYQQPNLLPTVLPIQLSTSPQATPHGAHHTDTHI